MAGHHDTILGAISGAERLIEVVRSFMYRLGTRPGAFDAWLVMRGLQTLAVRQERAAATAEEIAAWLAAHSAVRRVSFPGLGTHPDHRVARAQLSNGYGSTLSFEIGGGADGAERFVRALDMITLVHSLGGVRTTLSQAATMTHRSLSPAERTSAGLHTGFFRLSVGLEDASDIAADLSRGLAEVSS